jgi:hypothetical protein
VSWGLWILSTVLGKIVVIGRAVLFVLDEIG